MIREFLGVVSGALWWLNNRAAGHFRRVLRRERKRGHKAPPITSILKMGSNRPRVRTSFNG